jgi:hypothetical protein
MHEKLGLAFDIYDINGNGQVRAIKNHTCQIKDEMCIVALVTVFVFVS